jgi:hypothetical protein
VASGLAAGKGFDVLISAFETGEHAGFRLVIVGDRRERPRLERPAIWSCWPGTVPTPRNASVFRPVRQLIAQ